MFFGGTDAKAETPVLWPPTSFTSSQLQTLKNAFTENPYPGIDSREQLAEKIGVPESRVQVIEKGLDIVCS